MSRPSLLVLAAVLALASSAALGQSLVEIQVCEIAPAPQGPGPCKSVDRGVPGPAGASSSPLAPAGPGRTGPRPLPGCLPGVTEEPASIPPRVPPRPPQPPPFTPPAPSTGVGGGVHVARHAVRLEILDGVGVTEIDQVFSNTRHRDLEGTLVFPLPPGAVLTGFSIFMAGREVKGRVLEKERGRSKYETIVRRNLDPGLVELLDQGHRLIRARVFPIPGGGEMRVKMRYAQELDQREGRFSVSHPLRALRDGRGSAIHDLSLAAAVRSSWDVLHGHAADFALRTGSCGAWSFQGDFQAKQFVPARDFTFQYEPDLDRAGVAIHTGLDGSGKRFFMAAVAAGREGLRAPTLKILGASAHDLRPRVLPDIPPGGCIHVFGTFEREGNATAVLGQRAARPALRLPVVFGPARPENDFIAGLWAQKKVQEILDAKDLPGVTEGSLRSRILPLATRYGILTPYTVFYAD